MNYIIWPTILAQLSPATAGSTPTPTPSATPPSMLHLIANHPYSLGDIATLFIFIVLVVAVSFVIGLFFRKGGMEGLSKFFGDFTNVLAYVVVVLAFFGIFWLGRSVLGASDANKDNVKYVFSAILPLLGTWVGTVLAHYFQKENLAAATQSISDLASKVAGAGGDKLQSVPAANVMIKADQIETVPPEQLGKKSEDILLSDLINHLAKIKKDRVPLFKDDQGTYQKLGPADGVVHLSTIEKFISNYNLNPPSKDKKEIKDLSLADLNAHPDYPKFKSIFENSFGVIPENASLGRAKVVMDNLSQKMDQEIKAGCYDVFVTKTGDAKEPVLGWITNDIINDNAKV